MNSIILATRGSKLALAQALMTAEALRKVDPSMAVETRTVKTTGDRLTAQPLPRGPIQGFFTREIEEMLLAGDAHIAVHSHKDLPTQIPQGLVVGAVLPREAPFDALITRTGRDLSELPRGARVGTSSPRRAAMLLAQRSDLIIEPLRGNVDTRLRKVREGEIDAAVLAEAGLRRLGVKDIGASRLPPEICLPAPGQGAVALECRRVDTDILALLARVDDAATSVCVAAERAFCATLGGGCQAAVGALATIRRRRVELEGAVAQLDGRRVLRGRGEGLASDAAAIGRELAERLLAAGAGAMLESARRVAQEEIP